MMTFKEFLAEVDVDPTDIAAAQREVKLRARQGPVKAARAERKEQIAKEKLQKASGDAVPADEKRAMQLKKASLAADEKLALKQQQQAKQV